MKIHIFSSVCAVLVVFAHFLTQPSVIHAQNSSYISPIPGLRFDTPLPEKYANKSISLHFLSTYDMKTSDILTVKKTMPTPINVTAATTSSSMLDLLVPTVEASESTPSSEIAESTNSAVVAGAGTTLEDVIEVTPSPTAKTSGKVKATPSASAKSQEKASPSETPKSTSKPTESPTPSATAKPTPEPSSTAGGLSADKIFELVNNYRASKGLPPVQKDERACEVARSRAPEIAAEISGGYMHKGIRERALPYFNSEIIISMRSEEAAVQWWINDYIHRVQMEGDYKYSCAACSGNSCVQEFTNFVPKG